MDARAGITLDEKMQGSKEERERERGGVLEKCNLGLGGAVCRKKKEECTGSGRKGSRGAGRGVWTSGLETRVMAFLVLSCVRTLTLLAHIRA